MKINIKVGFIILCVVSFGFADKKQGVDAKVEKSAIDSLYSIIPLITNADKVYNLDNLWQAKLVIEGIVKSLSLFKGYDYINKAINYLKTAQKNIEDAYTFKTASKEDFLSRNFNIVKAQKEIFKAEQTIKFGEIPAYTTSVEEKKDLLNRVVSAKKALNEAIAKLKMKNPEIKAAQKSVQQVKELIRPFLKYQVINRVDIFLANSSFKYLAQALVEKDRLERERNIQNAILSIVYATEFLDDAEKDLQEIKIK